jgi:hypothetical protein
LVDQRRLPAGLFATLAWFERIGIHWTGAEPRLFQSCAIAERGSCPVCGDFVISCSESGEIGIIGWSTA